MLNSVQIFEGHPQDRYGLESDEVAEVGEKSVHLWSLHAQTGYWVQCGYAGTSVVMAKPLASGVTQCEAVWRGATES